MKQLIKFSKPSIAVIKNKASFFNENESLLNIILNSQKEQTVKHVQKKLIRLI